MPRISTSTIEKNDSVVRSKQEHFHRIFFCILTLSEVLNIDSYLNATTNIKFLLKNIYFIFVILIIFSFVFEVDYF